MATQSAEAARGVPTRPAIVVQHSLARPDGTTKYVDQIVSGSPRDVRIRFFSWHNALFGRYDVFHVHWPELMIRGNGRLRRFLKRRALQLLLMRLASQRIPLVRTLHNITPHEQGPPAEQRALARFERAVDLYIRLNPATHLPRDAAAVTILHGHYLERFSLYSLPPQEHGRILYFGIIREYKGVDRLLDAFLQLEDSSVTLRVVGSPSVGQREVITARCARDTRTSAVLRYVDDAELADEIGRAELVVLPYRDMHNSGSVILALSLARRVLVPHSASNDALSAEVGAGWIYQYEGELTPALLSQTLFTVRSTRPATATPNLSQRDWAHIGEQHRDAYDQVLEIRTVGS